MNLLVKAFEKEEYIDNLIASMSAREKDIYKLSLALIVNKLVDEKDALSEQDISVIHSKIYTLQNMSDKEYEERGEINGKKSN
jgi:hypothetical protein